MEFSEVVRRRRIVRHFRPDPVPPETIDHILDLARHAPTAGFTQGYSFVVVTRPDLRQAVGRISGEPEDEAVPEGTLFHRFVSEAPVQIIACTSEAAYHRRYQEPDKLQDDGTEITWPVPYWHMDVGGAVMLLLLAVVDAGLDAGFVGVFDPDGLRALLGIPAEVTPVGVIPIGYRAPDVPSPSLKRGRIPTAAYVHREGW